MTSALTLFGLTTLKSTLWNLAAYAAFISIIVGVCYERGRNVLITVGAAVLALYSGFFLKDPVFAALQTIITASGIMQLCRAGRKVSIVVISALTIIALTFLVLDGALQSVAMTVGIGGLLGIAFGIALLPKGNAFVLMTLGGVLLVGYALTVGAWVFLWLNIFFALANIREFFRTPA